MRAKRAFAEPSAGDSLKAAVLSEAIRNVPENKFDIPDDTNKLANFNAQEPLIHTEFSSLSITMCSQDPRELFVFRTFKKTRHPDESAKHAGIRQKSTSEILESVVEINSE